MINTTISAGLLCFSLLNCVFIPNEVDVYISTNKTFIDESCYRPVLGCAKFKDVHAKKDTILVYNSMDSSDTLKTRINKVNHVKSIMFHELLHMEYFYLKNETGHPTEFNLRDTNYAKYLSKKHTFINLKQKELT